MGSQVNPCITFNGNARQAMEFYERVFGGKLELSTVADSDKVMHSRLDTPAGYTLMAWDFPDDRPGHPPYRPGNNVALFLDADGDGDEDEGNGLRDHFGKLSEGGTVTLPLEQQVWGDVAGSLIDRFGITWMFNISTTSRGT
ncbi:VOC family protein [Streptomyces sp. NPDC048172]|uniref:VOC family protein n=1 Tax=Streptomyces sp. NPDC048172 TaxID=3365505 RepID=UPI003716D819